MRRAIVFRRPEGAKQTRSGLNNRARGSAPVVAGLGGSPTSIMKRFPHRGNKRNEPAERRGHCLPNCSPRCDPSAIIIEYSDICCIIPQKEL